MRCLIAIFLFFIAAMEQMAPSVAMPTSVCVPNQLEDVPLRVRKVCAALSSIYELAGAMESYLDTEIHIPMIGDVEQPQQLGAKRPDHMFMRFGKRR